MCVCVCVYARARVRLRVRACEAGCGGVVSFCLLRKAGGVIVGSQGNRRLKVSIFWNQPVPCKASDSATVV